MKVQRLNPCSPARATSPLRLSGIAVPRRVRAAFTTSPVDGAALQTELLALAARLAADADVRRICVADDLVDLVARALHEEPIALGVFALRVFATCVPCFVRVGRLAVPLRVARQLATCATAWPGLPARRYAYQFAAVVHLQADDARQAWHYAERAYACATDVEAGAERFETLVLAVCILDHMQLLGDARALALQLLEFPDDGPATEALHFVNAIHGLALSLRLDDRETGKRMHAVASVKAATRGETLDPIGARFEALSALHRARLGSVRGAARQLDATLARLAGTAAPRVEALLRSAQVQVYRLLDDRLRMESSLECLKGLLVAFDPASAMHRELLRTIICVESQRGGATAVAMRYLEALRERPALFSGESCESAEVLLQRLASGVADRTTMATMETEVRIDQEVATRDWVRDPWRDRRFADWNFEPPHGQVDAAAMTLPEREASLRSRAYETAENWAVVAEIAIGGDGRQCFKVGRIAASLASALGLSGEHTVLVELACRLRDIGDAAMQGEATWPRVPTWNGCRVVDDHAQAGARMLSFSDDPVLRSAARVALHHHAWWNGCGTSDGLGREAIPIEARICAVADRLVALVDPIGAGRPWPIETAMHQMRCMAGVQLDPELVDVLGCVLHDEGMRVEDSALKLNASSWNDPFDKSKKKRIETLELAA